MDEHDGHRGGHAHAVAPDADRRWLSAALALVLAFMAGEVIAGLAAHSLALLTDAGHMITDAAAIAVALVALRVARRPARGAYTYGFARVDALSGQANGITLLLLAVWFAISAVRRLIDPAPVEGGVVAAVALVGLLVNALATWCAGRANRAGLSVRGVVAHLVTDVYAFAATLVAGVVVLTTGWTRADPLASLAVAAVMAWTGWQLVQAAGRVFLEAAPHNVDPAELGAVLAGIDGVAEVHDLHVWQLGPQEPALSAHVLVRAEHDCHAVSGQLRTLLAERYGIGHVTLEADHADAGQHDAEHCEEAHGDVHTALPS